MYHLHFTGGKTQLSHIATFLGHEEESTWARPRPWDHLTRASITILL